MQSKADIKRQLILETAKTLVLADGFNSLTLEAVAKKAGISKGGLLYHFPNKEKLIAWLGEYIFQEFENNFSKIADSDPIQTGRWTRAFIEASKADLTENAELNVGVLASSILDSEVSESISEVYKSILTKIQDDGLDSITVDLIRLTLDGLYYSQTLNVAPLEKQRVNEVFDQLMKMTKCEG